MQCRSAISSRVTDLYRPCRCTKNGWNHGSRLSARGSSILTEPALTTPIRTPADADAALRPKSLAEFVGQAAARVNLRIFIEAAKERGDTLDHVLFFGPPGLGKSTLAQTVHRALGVAFCSSRAER